MKILVIEDEEKHRRVLGLHLASKGFEVKAAGTAEEGLKHAADADLVLTDLKLPGMDGLEMMEQLRSINAVAPVIVMSAFGTVEVAVEAMKQGAYHYANKPFDAFTREQLAGDLLPGSTEEQKVASGYNRLNMMTREGGAQPKEYLAKYGAERVRSVSAAWQIGRAHV